METDWSGMEWTGLEWIGKEWFYFNKGNIMSNFTTVKVHIKGTRPILFHAFREEVLSETKKVRGGSQGNDPTEWKSTVQMDEKRQLFVTHLNFFAMIKNAAKHTKIGRGTIKDKVGATIQIPPENYYLIDRFVPKDDMLDRDESKPVYLHVCSVKNPATKGRNLRYRVAASPGWEIKFTLTWDERIVSKETLKGVIEDAGILEGFMDGRNIGYGRFDLIDFEIIKD
jgi:hypothetical protein